MDNHCISKLPEKNYSIHPNSLAESLLKLNSIRIFFISFSKSSVYNLLDPKLSINFLIYDN